MLSTTTIEVMYSCVLVNAASRRRLAARLRKREPRPLGASQTSPAQSPSSSSERTRRASFRAILARRGATIPGEGSKHAVSQTEHVVLDESTNPNFGRLLLRSPSSNLEFEELDIASCVLAWRRRRRRPAGHLSPSPCTHDTRPACLVHGINNTRETKCAYSPPRRPRSVSLASYRHGMLFLLVLSAAGGGGGGGDVVALRRQRRVI